MTKVKSPLKPSVGQASKQCPLEKCFVNQAHSALWEAHIIRHQHFLSTPGPLKSEQAQSCSYAESGGWGKASMFFFMVLAAHGLLPKTSRIPFGPQRCHLSKHYSSELNHTPMNRKVNLFLKSPVSTQEGAHLLCRSCLCVIMFPQQRHSQVNHMAC